MRIKQSLCLPMFKNVDIGVLLKAVAEIGYPAVEFWGRPDSFEEQAAKIRSYGLKIASMGGHASKPGGLNQRSEHERIEAELKTSIDIAVKHGIPGVICLSGNRQPGVSEEEAIEITAEGLRRAAPYAEKNGVNLNLELLNSKVNHPGYQCDRTAWGVAVCKRADSPRVKLLHDIYHMQIMEGDVIRTIRDNIQWIGHFHTAGNPGRNDFDDTQELNYAGICRAIAETGYDLYVGHEFKAKGDPIEALRKAFGICDQG